MRLLLKILLTFSCCVSLHAGSPQWSLDQVNEGWNSETLVKQYFHHSELQRQWAWELIGKQTLTGREAILDFGCGDGKISAELSRLIPNGSVTGVDISTEMLKIAKLKFPSYAYPRLSFQQSTSLTFADIPGTHSFDLIISFCVFHQIAQPLDVLVNLKEHLKPDGKLVVLIPAGKNAPFFQAANEMFNKYQLEAPWKNQSGSNGPSMRTLEGCRELLSLAGYKILTLEMVDTQTPFYDKAELISWMVGTLTANWNIPPELSLHFFSDLVNRMIEIDGNVIDLEGRLNYKLSRIHLVACPE
jgi:trans-aconitate methyltransferase